MGLTINGKNSNIYLSAPTGSNKLTINTVGNSVVISSSQTDFSTWYSTFLTQKRKCILHGGTIAGQAFTKGLLRIYEDSGYLLSISSIRPDSKGNLYVTGEQAASVFTNPGEITIATKQLACPATEITKYGEWLPAREDMSDLVCRLSTAMDLIYKRLLVHNPTCFATDASIGTPGVYSGTAINYQAAVACWNWFVWKSSFIFRINNSINALSTVLGYYNTTCNPVSVTLQLIMTPMTGTTIAPTAGYLTLYYNGASGEATSVTLALKAGATTIYGRGDEKVTLGPAKTFTVDLTNLTIPAYSYYSVAVSIALGNRPDRELATDYSYVDVESSSGDVDASTITYQLEATVAVGNNTYSRTAESTINLPVAVAPRG